MGYDTDFKGSFQIDKPLTIEHAAYLHAFNQTRRMRRRVDALASMFDHVRLAVGLPLGDEGGYYVGGNEGRDTILGADGHNQPPAGQPGLWCQWAPGPDGRTIVWDEGEKFYHYEEWLEYLIAHFLKPWGYVLNGEVEWRGEEFSDHGFLIVEDNVVSTAERSRQKKPRVVRTTAAKVKVISSAYTVSPSEKALVGNALRAAADVYADDAKNATSVADKRLAEAMTKQRADALRLADLIDEADSLVIGGD